MTWKKFGIVLTVFFGLLTLVNLLSDLIIGESTIYIGPAQRWIVLGLLLLVGLSVLLAVKGPDRKIPTVLIQNLMLSLIVTLVTLLILEVALRLFPVKTVVYMEPRNPVQFEGRDWGHQYPTNPRGYFDEDNMVVYPTNTDRFRDDEFQKTIPDGTLRVTLLGDSFAFGEGVWLEDTAAYRLEGLLSEQAGCPVEVYNFARPGMSFHDYLKTYEEKAADYDTDVLVIWYFLNDVETGGTLGYLGADIPRSGRHLHALRKYSALVDLLGAGLDTRSATQDMIDEYVSAYQPDSERWQSVQRDMQRIVELADQNDTPVVLFVHPILFGLDDNYAFSDVHQLVIDAAQSAGMTACDLLPAFEGQDDESLWVHPVDQHPNEIAHEIAATYAADRIAPLLPDCP